MEQSATDNQDRAINLFINRFLHTESDQTYIDCFWIIDINHSTQFNALFEVYTAKSIHVLDLCTVESSSNQKQPVELEYVYKIESMVKQINESRESKCKK